MVQPSWARGSGFGLHDQQLQGKWLACRTWPNRPDGTHFSLFDLITGQEREFDADHTARGLALTTEMLVYTSRSSDYPAQVYREEEVDNALHIITFNDFALKTVPLAFPCAMQGSIRVVAHKQCVAIMRHRGAQPYDEHIQIRDHATDRTWEFSWQSPDDRRSFRFQIGADEQVFTIWSMFLEYASGEKPGMAVIKAMLRIERFSFAGDRIGSTEKQILLDDDDYRHLYSVGPWIWSLPSTGRPGVYATTTRWHGKSGMNVMIETDCTSSEVIPDYYRLHNTQHGLIWKNVIFHIDEEHHLIVSRNTDASSRHAKSLTRCDLRTLTGLMEEAQIGEAEPVKFSSGLTAVNESILVVNVTAGDQHKLLIFAFDRLITEREAGWEWTSTDGLFLQDDSASIVHRRITPLGPAPAPEPG